MEQGPWKVGQLAARTGVSVRTLHHYDQIGLLTPSQRTRSGHRLYTRPDVDRLQQIKSLRQLGFGLDEIAGLLDRDDWNISRVVGMHVSRLKEQIRRQRALCRRLEAITERLRSETHVSVEDCFRTIREIQMLDRFAKHYTRKQRETLARRAETMGQDAIRQAEHDWKELLAAVRTEMDKGTDPASQPVQELARRYKALIDGFTGGDPGIKKSLADMYRKDPHIAGDYGYTPDPAMFDFLGKALAAARQP